MKHYQGLLELSREIKYASITVEIKMRIVNAKEAFNRKIYLLTSKLNTELREKLVRFYVCSISLYG